MLRAGLVFLRIMRGVRCRAAIVAGGHGRLVLPLHGSFALGFDVKNTGDFGRYVVKNSAYFRAVCALRIIQSAQMVGQDEDPTG